MSKSKIRDIEKGLNARGIICKHPYEGGAQEHSLSQKYSSDAENIELTSPKTADILRSIAKNYKLQ